MESDFVSHGSLSDSVKLESERNRGHPLRSSLSRVESSGSESDNPMSVVQVFVVVIPTNDHNNTCMCPSCLETHSL